MKRWTSIILCFLLLLTVSTPALAVGDGNMDGGGGGMEDGSGTNKWSPGDDGVRVSIIRVSDGKRYKGPMDFTHVTYNMDMHFDKKSKIDYRGGAALVPKTTAYQKRTPAQGFPQIISPSGAVNIAEIKRYFCSASGLNHVAQSVGMDYKTLIGGKYKLLIEPLAFFTYNGIKIAATAHEVALYDQITSGDLRSKLGNLTHKNLPLAIFLEESDLGFPAWGGTTNGFVSNAEIISSLGLGIVRFTEEPDGPGDIELPDYEYHTDIDVITSFLIHGGEHGVTPDDNGEVTFRVNGKTQSQSYTVPPDETQLVWFEWHTPKTPQQLTIEVEVSGGGWVSKGTMTANIVELVEHTPPDPQPRDQKPGSFSVKSPPKRDDMKELTWGVWVPRWHENWVWIEDMDYDEETGEWEDNGYYEDQGWWEWDWRSYDARMSGDILIQPDSRVPTAYTGSYGMVWMKSGYGVNIELKYNTAGNHGGSITGAQNAIAWFPEFKYLTYDRVLEKTIAKTFEFRENLYSQVRHRVHFTPLWYPDDSVYEVQAQLIDCWTPAGMLRVSKSYDNLSIDGAVYDDWRWTVESVG